MSYFTSSGQGIGASASASAPPMNIQVKHLRLIKRVIINILRASLAAQMLKILPAVQESQVQSLGQEDALEKEMATHFSILAWRISWTQKPGEL